MRANNLHSRYPWCGILSILFATFSGLLLADAPATNVPLGSPVGLLRFKDIRFLERSLSDFPDRSAFVIMCANTTCPLVQRYLPVLKDLEQRYRDRGVQFLLLNVGTGDTIREMAAHALDNAIPFPAVKDVDFASVRALGVTRTPECVVLDANRMLCYRGRIDDQYRLGGARPAPTRNDLEIAIQEVLAGKKTDLSVSETPVDGCLITVATEEKTDKGITYHQDVAPLLRTHCADCHQPGTEAPFSLLTYDDATAQGDMLAEVIRDERMPPWYASPADDHFVNRRGMTGAEKETLMTWVRSGMPEGDVAKATPLKELPPVHQGGWLIGEPDLVLMTPQVDKIPDRGYVDYKYVVLGSNTAPWLPYVFLRETWIDRIQILPENNRVVHHCNLIAVPAVGEREKNARFITGKVPGGIPMQLTDGVAVRIPAGYMMIVQIHYTTTGKEESNRIRVGFRYARETVQKELRLLRMINHSFAISPGDPHYEVSDSKIAEQAIVGAGLFSHMHLRGKDMTFRAHYPDGQSETLLQIPNYNFDWQIGYQWPSGTRKFPAGTRFETIAHYDNSAFNPFNPDATATVREGDQSFEEMMYGFFFYTVEDEDLNLTIDPATGASATRSSFTLKED